MATYKFKDVEQLHNAANDYFKWCDENWIKGRETTEGDAVETTMHPRPYTFEGLCEHIGVSNWTQFVKTNSDREGFSDEFARIRNAIRCNQIEGALVGIFKESLTARLNGIADNYNITDKPPIRVLADEADE